jgi:hypothetical protein
MSIKFSAPSLGLLTSLVHQGYVEPSKFMNASVSLVAESKTFKSWVTVSSTVFILDSISFIIPLSSLRRL